MFNVYGGDVQSMNKLFSCSLEIVVCIEREREREREARDQISPYLTRGFTCFESSSVTFSLSLSLSGEIYSFIRRPGRWFPHPSSRSPGSHDVRAAVGLEGEDLGGARRFLEMSGIDEQLEIKFRLHDGSDIGPRKYPAAASVSTLKESILAQWPKDTENGPKTVNDVKLINAGKILENSKTLGECRSPMCDFSGGVTTMHVVVRPPSEKGSEKKAQKEQKVTKCGCVIL